MKGKTRTTAKFQRTDLVVCSTDLVVCSLFREG